VTGRLRRRRRKLLDDLKERRGYILRRNCLSQQVIEGKIKGCIEVTGRLRRRRRKLLDDLEESRGYSHLK
jgi:hypothetical protein